MIQPGQELIYNSRNLIRLLNVNSLLNNRSIYNSRNLIRLLNRLIQVN